MKIKIKNKEYELRYGLRSLFKYEQLTGHPYEGKTLEETYRFFHASLMACNESYAFSFEELIDACDEDPCLFESFKETLMTAYKRNEEYKKKVKEAAKP